MPINRLAFLFVQELIPIDVINLSLSESLKA